VIVGIGVDMVHTPRMERWREKPGLLERYFHPRELSAALSRGGDAGSSLAARFAAKEAFGKALGTGLRGLVLKDVWVVNDPSGKPELGLSGTALTALRRAGAGKTHISLAHEGEYALAVVVLETDGAPE
jgi:holo-[acyl-carrier protein] synthase